MANDAGDMGESRPSTVEPVKRHPLLTLALAILPPILAALAAYTGASGETREKSQRVKNASEAGYQFTLEGVESLRLETRRLEARLVRLDGEVAALKSALRRRSPPIRVAPPPPAVQPVAPLPTPLPRDLDKALELKVPPVAEVK